MTKKSKKPEFPPVKRGPSATYTEYTPSKSMRLAMERAARDQPPMMALGSNVRVVLFRARTIK